MTAAHSFEGKVFSVAASVALDGYTIDTLEEGWRGSKDILESSPPAVSLIVDPSGRSLAGLSLVWKE